MMHVLSCSACNKGSCGWSEAFCEKCFREIREDLGARNLPPENLRGLKLYSAGIYQRAYATFIKRAKAQPFNQMTSEYREFFETLLDYWAHELRDLSIDGIVSAPGGFPRSFFQSDLGNYVGAELSSRLKKPLFVGLLSKSYGVSSAAQKLLSRSKRWRHVREDPLSLNAAVAVPRSTQRFLLVDDICTTGATLMSCHEALRGGGFDVAGAFVLGRRPLAGS